MTFDKQTFSKNAKGYPALSKPHQALITRFFRLKNPPWLLLCDIGPLAQPVLSQNGMTILNVDSFPTLAETSGKILETSINNQDPSAFISYMRYLQSRQPSRTPIERFGAGYQDYLQAPLQPLTVNLESITYEVFEKDPIKYDWYEKAIARALHDWIEQGKPPSGPDGRVVVAVVGAGRGPLVTRALRAADGVDVEIDMWALEKNPNAFVLLQRHNATSWNQRVNLVKLDMRTWQGPSRPPVVVSQTKTGESPAPTVPSNPIYESFTGDASLDYSYLLATTAPLPSANQPYKIDILISELLGSFADNELSPECLDGVQHLMNPTHGISIPSSYTAYLSPIAAPKLHADILTQSASNANAAETPYVVMLNAIDHLSTTNSPGTIEPSQSDVRRAPSSSPTSPLIMAAWSFTHPNQTLPSIHSPDCSAVPSTLPTHPSNPASSTASTHSPMMNNHNARACSLTYPIPNRGTCHGLAGYFECVLYGNVELSTNPNSMDVKSPSMISWFPIYFPLKVKKETSHPAPFSSI